jgi:hypothetical protein
VEDSGLHSQLKISFYTNLEFVDLKNKPYKGKLNEEKENVQVKAVPSYL